MIPMKTSELMRRFCTAYYDEWVTSVLNGKGGPTLSAGLCRSFEMMMGEGDLHAFLKAEVEVGALEIIADYKTASWDEPVWILKDYMCMKE